MKTDYEHPTVQGKGPADQIFDTRIAAHTV